MDMLKEMGLRIKNRRNALGMTQEQLAELVGVSIQTISSAELGKKGLKPENIVSISRSLRCSTDYLLIGGAVSATPETIQRHFKNLNAKHYEGLTNIIKDYLDAVSSD